MVSKIYFTDTGKLRGHLMKTKKTAKVSRACLDAFTKYVQKHKMFVLIVEGKDDQAVWRQFLIKEYIPLTDVEIVGLGQGGIDEAIKLAVVFRGAKLQNVPNLHIIDSDNALEKTTELKAKGIQNYVVLGEKEIDSYLLDYEALAKILSVSVKDVQDYGESLKNRGRKNLRIYIGILWGNLHQAKSRD